MKACIEQPGMFNEKNKPSPSSIEQIKRMAELFDARGKHDQHIDVNLSRGYLLRFFRPLRRGGPVMHNRHELRAHGVAVIERAPKAKKKSRVQG